MFQTLKQRAMDLIREEALAEGLGKGKDEGRAEESARWQAWLERRIAANPELLDDDDPPPAMPKK